jgi:hypothetical protein
MAVDSLLAIGLRMFDWLWSLPWAIIMYVLLWIIALSGPSSRDITALQQRIKTLEDRLYTLEHPKRDRDNYDYYP